jgi:hypothetical protein
MYLTKDAWQSGHLNLALTKVVECQLMALAPLIRAPRCAWYHTGGRSAKSGRQLPQGRHDVDDVDRFHLSSRTFMDSM